MKQGSTVNIKAWKGINNVKAPEKIGAETLVSGRNVVIDNSRRIGRRQGMIRRVTGTIHSVWSNQLGTICLCVRNNDLVRIATDWSITTLRASVGAAPVAFLERNGVIFYSNGSVTGCIDLDGSHRTWGLSVPSAPSLSLLAGSMQAGTYRVLVTYLRNDGQESGSGQASSIDATADSAIRMVLPVPTDPTIEFKCVYGTEPDGQVFRQIGFVPIDTTTFTWNGELNGMECPTMFMGPPPAGTILAEHYGVVLIGMLDTIWQTIPFSPELVDLSHGYRQLDGQVEIIGPVDDGVYLAWDGRIGWAEGRDFFASKLQILTNYGSIPGTMVYYNDQIDEPNVRPQIIERQVVWLSHQGIVKGGPGGMFGNMTAGIYQNAITPRGAGLAIQDEGEYRYIVTLQGRTAPGNVFISDANVDTSHYVGVIATLNGLTVSASI